MLEEEEEADLEEDVSDFESEEALPEAAEESALVVPSAETLELTFSQVIVPATLSMVPLLSAEVGVMPLANFAVTFFMEVIEVCDPSVDRAVLV